MREKTASVMPVEEWKQVVRLLHSDRYPEEYRANLDKAMGILRQRIEPALNQRPDPRPASSYADIHRRAEAAKNGRPH